MLASVGLEYEHKTKPKIAIVSTGSELMAPSKEGTVTNAHKIFDSNTIMLEQLLIQFGFECQKKIVLGDE